MRFLTGGSYADHNFRTLFFHSLRPGGRMLEVHDLTVRFGGITALDGVGFSVGRGEMVGLIGPNGAGKTTLFNCLTRRYGANSGTVRYEGTDLLAVPPHAIARLGIARTFQNLGLFPNMSVRDNVLVGAHHHG